MVIDIQAKLEEMTPALIQALYASLTDKEGFHRFLGMVCEAVNACAAELVVVRKQPLQIEHLWYSGLSNEFMDWYLSNNMIEQDVVSLHATYQPPGNFQTALALLENKHEPEEYGRWESDQDMLDTAWLVVHASKTHATLLTMQRTVEQGPYSSEELAALNRLVPFIRQAVLLYESIDRMASVASTLAGAIEALPNATLILNDQAELVYANKTAQALMSCIDGFSISGKRLCFSDQQQQNDFIRSSIHIVRASMGQDEYCSETIFIKRDGAGPLIVILRPFESDGLPFGGVMVSVFDRSRRDLPNEKVISDYFSLSPAEAMVCEGLVSGLSLKEIAKNKNKSEATIRSYLKQVFQKTGYRRQGELISGMLCLLMS